MGSWYIDSMKNVSRERILNIRRNLIKRCYDSKDHAYARYGGRGIKVCKEWLDDRESFYDWAIKNGYSDDLSIDRIDNNGDYSPENCRWTTAKVQANNRTSNNIIEFDGLRLNVSQWGELTGMKARTISRRIANGWTVRDALTKKPRRWSERIMIWDGTQYRSLSELSVEYKIPRCTLRKRFDKGWPFEEIVKTDYIRNSDDCHKRYEYKGKRYTLKEISELTGVSDKLIYDRVINYKMSVEDAISLPLKKKYKTYTYNGKEYSSLKELCIAYGVSNGTISYRVNKLGESLDEAMEKTLRRLNKWKT